MDRAAAFSRWTWPLMPRWCRWFSTLVRKIIIRPTKYLNFSCPHKNGHADLHVIMGALLIGTPFKVSHLRCPLWEPERLQNHSPFGTNRFGYAGAALGVTLWIAHTVVRSILSAERWNRARSSNCPLSSAPVPADRGIAGAQEDRFERRRSLAFRKFGSGSLKTWNWKQYERDWSTKILRTC